MTKIKHFSPVILLTVCMTVFLLGCLNYQVEQSLLSRLSFQDTVTGSELVPFYNEEEQKHYVFLPPYMAVQDIHVAFLPGGRVHFASEGESLGRELSGAAMQRDITLELSFLWFEETATYQIWQCSSIPTLQIRSHPDVLSYLHEDRNNRSNVTAALYDPEGAVMLERVGELSGRGNSTWAYQAKRPYELKLDAAASFGGFEDIRTLCLLAEYSDESKIHNAVGYYIAGIQNVSYASGYQHVNLYVNGEYMGLYGIATKEEYKKDIQSAGIQTVFEIATNTGNLDFQPRLTKNPVKVHYGDADLAEAAVAVFEEALCSGSWDACREIIDPRSFAKKYLLEEVQGNSDLTNASQYFYLDSSGKIGCMLPWDYDLSLGYTSRYFNNKQVYEIEAYRDSDGWNALLLGFPEFREQVLQTLQAGYDAPFVSKLETYMKTTAEQISDSWQCDILRWRNARPFASLDRSCGEGSLEGMVELYAAYFSQRIAYLEEYLTNWEDSCLIEFQGDQYSNLCVPSGADLWDYLSDANILRGEKINPGFQGWYTEDGRQPEDFGIVTEDIVFYARYGSDG